MASAASASTDSADPHDGHVSNQRLVPLTVGAIGVVFGDIGTSPLYALRDTFAGHHPLPLDQNIRLMMPNTCSRARRNVRSANGGA